MRPNRRSAYERTKTRTAILDAAADIMRKEGYAAVSSRRIAEKAGLKSQLVHYHFGAMDDLFLALMNKFQEEYLSDRLTALTSPNPLRALWELSIDSKDAVLTLEFIALANHKKFIRDGLARGGEREREIKIAIVSRFLRESGIDAQEVPPSILCFILDGVSRAVMTESVLGMTAGRSEMLAFADGWLRQLERRTPRASRRAKARPGGRHKNQS